MSTNISVASYLNQIFYPHNKFDDRLNELEPWMLTADKIKVVVPGSEEKESLVPTVKDSFPLIQPKQHYPPGTQENYNSFSSRDLMMEKGKELECSRRAGGGKGEPWVPPKPKKQIFSPIKTDTLFWCAYTINKGEAEYEMIGNRYKNAEIDEKQKMIDFIKKNPDAIKSSFKITAVKMKEIMSELMMDTKTSWTAFLAMCVYYKFSAIICYKKTFLEFCVKGAEHTHLFHRDASGHISVDTNALDETEINDIRNARISLGQNPEKPLKAVSHYKMDDLAEIAEKLGVMCGQNKWKKADWYDAILKELEW
jgi:hypothetical protein